MIVRVRKAKATIKAEPIGDVMIVIGDINGEISDQLIDRLGVDRLGDLFHSEAADIAAALVASLPGGTLDQLTAILLERKASSLRVRAF